MALKDFTEIEIQLEQKDDDLKREFDILSERLGIVEQKTENCLQNEKRIDHVDKTVDNVNDEMKELTNVMENVLDKFYEFENQKAVKCIYLNFNPCV